MSTLYRISGTGGAEIQTDRERQKKCNKYRQVGKINILNVE